MTTPATPQAALLTRLRMAHTDWDGSQMADEAPPMDSLTAGDVRQAGDEITRLHGQMETLGRWIVEALKVLDTIDPDDMEESEKLMSLIKAGEMLTVAALAPNTLAKLKNPGQQGPACNLLRPWEAPV